MFRLNETAPILFDGARAVTGDITPWVRLSANGDKHTLPYRGSTACGEDTAWLFEDAVATMRVTLHTAAVDGKRTAGLSVSLTLNDTAVALNPRAAVGFDIAPPADVDTVCATSLCGGDYWTEPHFLHNVEDIADFTQTLMWQPAGGDYYYATALCGDDYKAAFAGGRAPSLNRMEVAPADGALILFLTAGVSGLTACESPMLIIAAGDEPFGLPRATLASGFALLGKPYTPKEARHYPAVLNYLGWCSWDAFHMFVSYDKLMAKAEEFRQKALPVRWLLIDDMWAHVKGNNAIQGMHSRTLYDFEADPDRFPQGLKGAIADLKREYGVAVGMWHPSTGYWSGIDPTGPIAATLGDSLRSTGDDGYLMPDLADGKAYAFYEAFHRFLADCGADFTKIDYQSYVQRRFFERLPVGRAAYALHQAIEDTVDKYYGGALINCMGMATENFWNRPRSAVSRCSNDFQPENRDWFRRHLLQCSFNSYTQGCLYVADWDMWWTDDSQAHKNSVLRAISGGPVYLSDTLGRSQPEVIHPIVLSDGYILRCDNAAIPTADCLLADATRNGKAFKVWNRIGDVGTLAAFNLDAEEKPVVGTVGAGDFPFADAMDYVLWDWHTRCAVRLTAADAHTFTLAGYDDFRLYLLVPMVDGFAPLGLIDKYMAPAAILTRDGSTVTLKEGGLFGFVADNAPAAVLADGEPVTVTAESGHYTAVCGEVGKPVTVTVRF